MTGTVFNMIGGAGLVGAKMMPKDALQKPLREEPQTRGKLP